ASDFINVFKIDKRKIVVINNPITNNSPLKETSRKKSKITRFITVGRLSNEKGHLRIIKLLSQLKFNFHYTIIGEGPLNDEIFKTISNFNLNDKVTHIPYTNNVAKYLSENDAFLQGSYVEGFPNTALESCLVGTPVIAFNVPGGTKEIILHGENGYLAENETEYLKFLNSPFIDLYPDKIRSSITNRFSSEKIVMQYEKLFN